MHLGVVATTYFEVNIQKPIKLGNSWHITVRHNGQRYNVTRDIEEECIKWASFKLLELNSTESNLKDKTIQLSFRNLFEKYYLDVGFKMRGARYIQQHLKAIDKYWGKLANKPIHEFTP